MRLHQMSPDQEYFLFEDRVKKYFRVYTLKNLAVPGGFISDYQRHKKSGNKHAEMRYKIS